MLVFLANKKLVESDLGFLNSEILVHFFSLLNLKKPFNT